MKRKTCRILLLIAAITVGAMALTGCSALDKSGTASDTSDAGDASGSQSAAGNSGTQDASGTQTTGDTQNIQADQSAGTAQQQPDVSTGEPDGEVIPDEWADAAEAENAAEDTWSGTYISDEESVTVTMLDESTISFAFAQSGISGTAQVNGNQAVFNGDDYHVVVFSLNDTVLNIAVSSEEDFDASSSPLNGTFIRQAG